MLIKTQVKRRVQTINQYVSYLKIKVNNNDYKQAIEFLKKSKDTICNSYMSPYNPNAYLLDSLKTKNQKLIHQKQIIEQQILHKLEDINKIKLKRGYTKYNNNNNNYKSKNGHNIQFLLKLKTNQVSAYISRLSLKLQDVQKIDYQNTILETDFQILRILIQQRIFIISFYSIISIETDDLYILLCWKDDKKVGSNIHMILKFQEQDNRVLWTRCMNFSKLICESQLRNKLFYKQERIASNVMNVSGRQQSKWSQQQQQKQSNNPKNSNTNLNLNVNINTNKSSAFDRLRRKSQYYPTLLNNNSNSVNRTKERKASEDLNLKQPFFKRLNTQKSQISFDDQVSVVGSNIGKKQQRKNSYLSSSKMQRLVQQRQKLQSQFRNQGQNSNSNKQIFYNQSSIHWIQQQNQQLKSKSSGVQKIKSIKRLTYQQQQNKDESLKGNSYHISEVAAQIQQSPLLPYNMRQKRRNIRGYDNFEVKVHEVQKTNQYQKSNKSSSHSKINKSGNKINKMDQNQQYEQQQNIQIEKIQSINQQLDDQQQQQSEQKISRKNRSNLQVSDRSQDIVSQNQISQTQSIKYQLDYLKSGIILLKCSQNSWNVHKKKLHLSNNDIQLCWKNQRGDDLKKIFLSDIQKIQYNKISPGVIKHIKNIQIRRCLAIKYKYKNQYKMLEFYLPQEINVKVLEKFYQKLYNYVKFKNNLQ